MEVERLKKIAKNAAAICMSLVMSATAAMGSFAGYESFFNEIAVSAEASTEMTIKSVSKSDKIYKFSWNSVKGATEYRVYRDDVKIATVKSSKKRQYTDYDVHSGNTYYYRIEAYRNGTKVGVSNSKKAKIYSTCLIYVGNDTKLYTLGKKKTTKTLFSGYYSGYVNNDSYKGYYVIYAQYGRYLIPKSAAEPVNMSEGKILTTGCVSQLGGTVYTGYACGPTNATIFYNGTFSTTRAKGGIILDAKKFRVPVFGDYTFTRNGISVHGIATLLQREIKKIGLNKQVRKEAVAGRSTEDIKNSIKTKLYNDQRVLSCIRHTSQFENGRIVNTFTTKGVLHYSVVTGYTVENGVEYFYCADSWFSVKGAYEYAMKHGRRNGSKYMNYYYGLTKVPADVYANSIRSVPNGNFGYMLYVE